MGPAGALLGLAAGLALVLLALREATEAGRSAAAWPRLAAATRGAGERPLLAFLAGAGGTVLLGSSSAWVILLEALADAGAVDLAGAVAMVLGANVGTTLTSHVAAAPLPWPCALALWAAGRASAGRARRPAWRTVAGTAGALGALLAGLDLLGGAARAALAGAGGAGWLESALGGAGAGWGFLVGTAATALAFSSALVVGLLERLLQAGALGLGQAIPVLLGSDLGTVADTLLAAAALGRRARAVAAAHLLFNLAADLAWLLLGREALARAAGALAAAPAARLAMAHSLLNLLAALPLLPARRALARAALALAGAGAD